jgi:formate/nitrite transporter FocA (FNT family)
MLPLSIKAESVVLAGHYSGLYNTDALITYSKAVAVTKTSEGFGRCLLRGVGCNFLGQFHPRSTMKMY